MSPWIFTSAILEGRSINVFNFGKMQRDFTFVEDIAEATVRCLDKVPAGNQDFSTNAPDPSTSHAPYRIYNVSNHQPVELMTFIKIIEEALGKKAIMNFLPLQQGDLITTYADIARFKNDIGFEPSTSIEKGISDWLSWYSAYCNGTLKAI